MVQKIYCLAIAAIITETARATLAQSNKNATTIPASSPATTTTTATTIGDFPNVTADIDTNGNIALFSVDYQTLEISPEILNNAFIVCRNNDNWVSATATNNNTCQSIGLLADSLRNEMCQLQQVQQNCPVTCGICCEDDPDYVFERENNGPIGCSWLSQNENRKQERQDAYCNTVSNGMLVRTACPKSCDVCAGRLSNLPPVPRPNLVMVITDEHNLRTLSCYRNYLLTKYNKEQVDVWGEDVILDTPNIDSLAAKGALYTNFYTVAPVCTPSRASFMSGMHPIFAGNTSVNNGEMDESVTTWAEILRNNGYATSYVGKFHLDGLAKPGWGAPKGRDFGFEDNRFRFNRGHWKYFEIDNDGTMKEYEHKDRNRFVGRYDKAYVTDFLMDRGIEFIEKSVAAGDPFAVVISIPDPHAPNKNRPPYDTMFDSLQFKVPETGRKNMKFQPASPRFHDMNRTIVDSVDEYIAELESDFFLSHMQQYFGMVKCVDDNIGKLIQKLKNLGVEDDTVVVFTSDHGDLLMEHGKFNKGNPYKTSASIPFILKYPRKIQSGKIIDTAYSSIDFAPTVLSLMGVEDTSSATFQGVDGSAELTSSESVIENNKDQIIFSFDNGNRPRWVAAISDGYKLVFSKRDVPWLFDMNTDHDELVNYANSELHQEIYARLRDALIDAMRDFQAPLLQHISSLYLDLPACVDIHDAIHLKSRRSSNRRKNPTVFCDDLGVTINRGRCIGAQQVRQQCPMTCGTCCMDSPGQMWVDSQIKGCSSLSMHCNDALVQAFCPETCNMCDNR